MVPPRRGRGDKRAGLKRKLSPVHMPAADADGRLPPPAGGEESDAPSWQSVLQSLPIYSITSHPREANIAHKGQGDDATRESVIETVLLSAAAKSFTRTQQDDDMDMSDEDRPPPSVRTDSRTTAADAGNDGVPVPTNSRMETSAASTNTSVAARSALLKAKRKAALKAKHLALTKHLLEKRATTPPPVLTVGDAVDTAGRNGTLEEEVTETEIPAEILDRVTARHAAAAWMDANQEVRVVVDGTCAVPRLYPQDLRHSNVDQVSQTKQGITLTKEESASTGAEKERAHSLVPAAEQVCTESRDATTTHGIQSRDTAVLVQQRNDLLRQIAEAQETLQTLRKSKQSTVTNESEGGITESASDSESIANQEPSLGAHLTDLQLEEAYMQVGVDASADRPSKDVTSEALIEDWKRQELLRRKKAAEQKKQLSHYKHLLSKQEILLERQKAETEATAAKIDKINEQRREAFTQLQRLPDKISELYARQRVLEGMLNRSNEELKRYGPNAS
jgi:hypothetical protein